MLYPMVLSRLAVKVSVTNRTTRLDLPTPESCNMNVYKLHVYTGTFKPVLGATSTEGPPVHSGHFLSVLWVFYLQVTTSIQRPPVYSGQICPVP